MKRIGGALSFKQHYRMCEAIGILLMDRNAKLGLGKLSMSKDQIL